MPCPRCACPIHPAPPRRYRWPGGCSPGSRTGTIRPHHTHAPAGGRGGEAHVRAGGGKVCLPTPSPSPSPSVKPSSPSHFADPLPLPLRRSHAPPLIPTPPPWRDVVWCGAGCGVVWRSMVWCGAGCGVVWRSMVWCGAVWGGVVWGGVVWGGVGRCGVDTVLWCGGSWCDACLCGVGVMPACVGVGVMPA